MDLIFEDFVYFLFKKKNKENKATLDKVYNECDQECSKELKNHKFISVEMMVVKLLWKMYENLIFHVLIN